MRKIYLLLLSVLFGLISNAQVTGAKNIPTDYPTIAAALTTLNTSGVGAGGATITITAGYTETAPAGGFQLGSAALNATTSSANQLIFVGNNNVITAPTGTSTSLDGIFSIKGTDYVTISGLSLKEAAGNTTATTAMEWGFGLFNLNNAAPFDGCQNDIIKNCTITLNRTIATASKGIFVAHQVYNSTTGLLPTAATDMHSNNSFYTNNISNLISAIYIGGATSANDVNNDIGGTSAATGNSLTNCIGALYSSVGAITATYQTNANISYNTINNTANGGTNAIATAWGIYAYGPNCTYTVSNNTITLVEAAISTAYAIYGIYGNAAGTNFTLLNNTVDVSEVSGSAVNNIAVFIPNGNNSTVTGNTVKQTMAVSGTTYGIYTTSTGVLAVNGNTLTQTATAATSSQFYSIVSGGTAVSETEQNNVFLNTSVPTASSGYMALLYTSNGTGNKTITGNVTSGTITHNSSSDFYGILDNPASAPAAGTATFANNNFSGINKSGIGGTYLIYTAPTVAGTRNSNLNNNTISNITSSGTGPVVGVYYGSGGAVNVFQNTISGLTSAGGVFGIYGTSPASVNASVYKNQVFTLSSTATATGGAYGITVADGTTANVYNNFIRNLQAASISNTADAVRGINLIGTGANTSVNVYYNTIYLNAVSSGANFSTSGIYHTASATATTAALDLRNNIIVNTSTANGSGTTAAYRRSGTALGNFKSSSNNNLFYAGTPSPSNVIFNDGTNSDQTLANYQTRVAAADAASITGMPTFISATDLHLTPASNCAIDGKAAPISGYTLDADDDVRNASTPDIGADEFTNTFTFVVTNPAAVCAPATVNITAPAVTAGSTTGTTITYWADAAATTPIPPANGTPAAISVSGTYYIKSAGTGSCTPVLPVVVVVNPVPVITPTFTQPTTCVTTDGAINISVTGGTGTYSFAWTGPGVNATSQNQTGLIAGDYTVTVTDIGNPTACATTVSYNLPGPGGCTLCPTIGSVTTNPSPSGCIGAPVTLTASGLTSMGNTYGIIFKSFTSVPADPYTGGTVLATVNNASLTSSGTVATATTSFAAANTYYIYAILTPTPASGLCRPANSATFVINPTPTAVATPATQTACSAATITPIVVSGAVSGTTYNWTRNNTATVTGIAASGSGNISGALINTTNAAVTVTFTITPTANGCDGTPITATVLVNPTANAVATPAAQTICSNTPITAIALTGNVTGTTYNWVRDNTATVTGIATSGSGNISGTLVNTGATPVTVTFTITPSFGGCNGTPITATVLVNPIPSVTQPGDQTVCNGSATTAVTFAGTVTGTVYNWSNNTTSIGLAANGSGNIASFTGVNTGTTAVTATVTVTPTANGCGGTAKTFAIIVNPTPTVTAVANQTVCAGTLTAAITFAGAVTGTTYNWTNNTTSIGLGASGSGNIAAFTAVNNTNAPITATITVTPTAGSCPGTPKTFTITVNPNSIAPTGATSSGTTFCGTGTVNLSVQGGQLGTGASWKWYSGSCGGTLVGTGATLTGIVVNGTTTFYVRAEGTCNTTTCASVTVTINPIPVITLSAAPYTSLRPPLTTTITANITPSGGNTIVWYKDGNVITGATTNVLSNLTVDQLGTYTVGVTTVAGCSAVSAPIVIKDSSSDKLFITPNPNNGQFKIRYYTNYHTFGFLRTVIIYDNKGEKVLSKQIPITGPYSSMDIDIRKASHGLYIIVVADFNGVPLVQGKVVIE